MPQQINALKDFTVSDVDVQLKQQQNRDFDDDFPSTTSTNIISTNEKEDPTFIRHQTNLVVSTHHLLRKTI